MASPLERKALRGGLPPRPPMMKPPGRVGGASGSARRSISATKDFSPLSWNQYFSESKDIRINEESSFRVYLKGEVGPVLLLLHGGGFSALTWSCYTASISYMVQCRCAALDLRGHGDTTTDDDANLSAETLSKDVADVVQKLYGDDPPAIVLMGHSMGGALAIHLAHKDLIPSLIGLIVIDVVEGTALEALSNMQTFLRGRPKSFESLERAIEWAVKTGHIRNQDSARVSMIGQLKKASGGETATHELEEKMTHGGGIEPTKSGALDSLAEDEEDNANANVLSTNDTGHSSKLSLATQGDTYTWRIDLSKTEPYWKGWFKGMSQLFLGCGVPKLLLLAGVDRLDKDLTIGQMQGKFQMIVLPQSGHAVHEDAPDKVAESVATFLVRNKFAEATANFEPPFSCC